MRIYLNGKVSENLPAAVTVRDLVEGLGLAGKRIAVELDGEIVPRSAHAETILSEGCRVEVVRAIGGG